MSNFGVNKFGFKKKSREDILKDMEITARNLFGDNINLKDNSPLGLFIKLLSYPLALIWHGLEGVYNSAFINTATDQSLDYLGQYVGIVRREASKAKGVAKFVGEEGFEIPKGFLIETESDPVIQFRTTQSGVISPNNSVEVKIELLDPDEEGNISAHTITSLVDAIAGINKVDNPTATVDGAGTARFTGAAQTVIPEGLVIGTNSEPMIKFKTIESKTITASENSVELPIEAANPGLDGNVVADTITQTVNKHSELKAVTNPFATDGGADRENDSQFRRRYKRSVAGGGAATIDSITAQLYKVPNVQSLLVRENNTAYNHQLEVDGDNLPAKSIEAVVLGGAREDIAKTILKTKAAGIQSYGKVEVKVSDSAGNKHSIYFSRPESIAIYIQITNLEIGEDYPVKGEDKIKDEIIKYIGGKDTAGDGWSGTKFGERVIYNKVIEAIFKVAGVNDADVMIRKEDGEFTQSNLILKEVEMAISNPDNITVDVKEQ